MANTITAVVAANVAANQSADIEIADDTPSSFSLFQTAVEPQLASDCQASLRYKTSAGTYIEFAALDWKNPVHNVVGPITVKVWKKASAVASGVDQTTTA